MKSVLRLSAVVFFVLIPVTVFAADKKKANPSELGETAIGDVVSDAMRTALGTDVAFIEASSVGTKPLPEKITRDNLSDIVPFGEDLVVSIEVKGGELREALERSVSFLPRRFGGFLQVSGVSFTCDLNRKPGERISGIRVGGKPMDDKKTYAVALTEFLAGGGNGYKSFRKGEPVVEKGIPLGEIVLKYAKSPGKKKPPARIAIISLKDKDS